MQQDEGKTKHEFQRPDACLGLGTSQGLKGRGGRELHAVVRSEQDRG